MNCLREAVQAEGPAGHGLKWLENAPCPPSSRRQHDLHQAAAGPLRADGHRRRLPERLAEQALRRPARALRAHGLHLVTNAAHQLLEVWLLDGALPQTLERGRGRRAGGRQDARGPLLLPVKFHDQRALGDCVDAVEARGHQRRVHHALQQRHVPELPVRRRAPQGPAEECRALAERAVRVPGARGVELHLDLLLAEELRLQRLQSFGPGGQPAVQRELLAEARDGLEVPAGVPAEGAALQALHQGAHGDAGRRRAVASARCRHGHAADGERKRQRTKPEQRHPTGGLMRR
mmetsp:Transcript_11368/g.30321  ORF Transcript_11368/g.30321 Transcript_11368/m.30321 type:complete len:291 (-) Transcript_11368:38-910(-)